MLKNFLDESKRAYLYRVILAAASLLVGYGILKNGDVENVTLLIGALLGVPTAGLAALNTKTKK